MHLWRQAKAVSTSHGLFFTLAKKMYEPLGAHTPIYPVFNPDIVHFKPMSCSKQMPSHISFAEIIPDRDSSVRVTKEGHGDVVDVIMVVTGKDCNQANEVFRRMDNALFDKAKCFIQNGRRYATLRDIITLIMVLPGKIAKEIRSQFAEIIENYIRENLASGDVVPAEHSVGFKRRREELEVLRMELEISTMRVNCYKQEEEARSMAQARILSTTAELERIRDPLRSNLDDRTRLMIQDALQNTILNSMHQGSLTITNGHSLSLSTSAINNNNSITNNNSTNAPISISSVAAELGYKPSSADAKRIGIDIKKRYMKLHNNQAPPKHDQLCDGRVTQVNSYTNKDRPILVEALRAYFSPPSLSSSGDSCDF